jgi:glucose-6-phosphate dehydrogenase assembly protein OpcA
MEEAMIFNPEKIERELEEIQRQNSPTEARTAILNLLVFSRREAIQRTDAALGHVVGKRAARVIHVVQRDQAESDVSLSARCYLDRERKSVCVQEILIDNGHDGVGAAPGSWTPLLIRDLPVYAIWFDTLAENAKLLVDLQEQCDTLIVDTEQSVAFGEDARSVVRTIKNDLTAGGVVVSDFTWQRVAPLRRLTARYFDPPRRRERMEHIRRVDVSKVPPVFGSLYLSWLASRLGWYVDETRVADHTAADLRVALSPAAPGRNGEYNDALGNNGQSVTLRFTYDDGSATTIRGEPDGTALIQGPEEEEERVSYHIPTDGEIVLAEIDAVRNENLYTEALGVLGTAPWAP